jgi:hypothetical protein
MTAVAVANITAWRKCASTADVESGREWYPLARSCAQDMATKYGVSLDVAAGVVAVTSPNVKWLANLDAAETLIRAFSRGDARPDVSEIPAAVYGLNIRKAWRILQHGADFPRCNGRMAGARGERKCNGHRDDCPAADYLHGPKVVEFHETILGKLAGRVVDVWATRAADVSPYDVLTLARTDPRCTGVPGSRLPALQVAYAAVAETIGEDAAILQAIVWTCIRRTWRMRGAVLQTEIPF